MACSLVTEVQKSLLLIINPVSGKITSHQGEDELVNLLKGSFSRVDAHYTSARGDAVEIARQHAGNYDSVACLGGDGTINEVVTGMLRAGLARPLICLPAGTTNLLADTLHMPSRRVLEAAALFKDREARPFDVGMLDEHCFLSVVSFGAFADSSYKTSQKLKNRLGYGAYVLGGARSLFSIHPEEVRVEYDGGSLEGEFIFGSVSNCAAVGGVIKFPEGDVVVDDGLYEAVFVRKPKNLAGLFRIFTAVRKRDYSMDGIVSFKTDSLRLTSSRPIPWTIDGEYMGDFIKPSVSVMKHAIKLVY